MFFFFSKPLFLGFPSFTAVIIWPWTPKICLSCVLCCNQSQARSSEHRKPQTERMGFHRSRDNFVSRFVSGPGLRIHVCQYLYRKPHAVQFFKPSDFVKGKFKKSTQRSVFQAMWPSFWYGWTLIIIATSSKGRDSGLWLLHCLACPRWITKDSRYAPYT